MHTCRQLTEEVTRYLEGELSMAEWAQTRVHLMMCPACRVYLEQMKQTRHALSCLADPPPPDEVTQELVRMYRAWLDGCARGATAAPSADAAPGEGASRDLPEARPAADDP